MQTTAQLKNLKPIRSTNEAREKGRKGGLASGIVRNKNKSFKALIKQIAHTQIEDTEAKEELQKMGLDTDFRNYIFLKVFNEATKNNNYKAQQKLFDSFMSADTDIKDAFSLD